jgi:hypothetical protein
LSEGIFLNLTPNYDKGHQVEEPHADVPSDAAITRQRMGSRFESQRTALGNIGGGGITALLEKIQNEVQKPPYQCQAFQASSSHELSAFRSASSALRSASSDAKSSAFRTVSPGVMLSVICSTSSDATPPGASALSKSPPRVRIRKGGGVLRRRPRVKSKGPRRKGGSNTLVAYRKGNGSTGPGWWYIKSPDYRRYARLSGESKYPVGARPSKCIIIIGGGSSEVSKPPPLATTQETHAV